MRLYIILVFFLITATIKLVNAQSWVNPENRWHVLIGCTGSEPFGGSEVRAYFLKDTLVHNGQIYLQMHQTLDTTFQTSTATGNYYREEANKVYIFQPGGNERLIYDFNLTVGDTITINIDFFQLPLKVISSDSITLENGSKRKRLIVQDNRLLSDQTAVWIEGIGSEVAPFDTWQMFISDCGSGLHCFYQNDQLSYQVRFQNSPLDCTLFGDPVSVQEIPELAGLKVAPNPFTSELYLEAELLEGFSLQGDYLVSVFDVDGKQMYQRSVSWVDDLRIQTATWRSGFYILVIQSATGVLSKKLVKI